MSALERVPGLAGYLAAQQHGQAQQMGQLQQAQAVMGLQGAIQQRQREEALRATLANSGGDVEKAMAAAIQAGDLAGAAKLAPLVEEKRKATAPRVLTPGSQMLGADNKVV